MQNKFTKDIKLTIENEMTYFHELNKTDNKEIFANLLMFHAMFNELITTKILNNETIEKISYNIITVYDLLYYTNYGMHNVDLLQDMEYKYLELIMDLALQEEEYEVCENIKRYLNILEKTLIIPKGKIKK